MKQVRYTADALRDLKRLGSMTARFRKALAEYAANPNAHANNVIQMTATPGKRMRVGDYRIIFVETADVLTVTRIGPRSSVYD